MMPARPPDPEPHPLVAPFLRVRAQRERVLLLGAGSGRSLAPLLAAGLTVAATEPDAERRAGLAVRFAAAIADGSLALAARLPELAGGASYVAALSTHALLHGTPASIGRTLTEIAACLAVQGRLVATIGSRRDPRFGAGRRIDEATFAPEDGREAGVAHAYFDMRGLMRLFAGWKLVAAEERSAAESAGAWAHDAAEAAKIVHWFVTAEKRA